jgi:amino acid permease
MTRLTVLALALAFIVGFAALTVRAVAETGFTLASLLSVLILVLLAVGIIGAMRNPPR